MDKSSEPSNKSETSSAQLYIYSPCVYDSIINNTCTCTQYILILHKLILYIYGSFGDLSAKKDQKLRALPHRAVASITCTSSCIYYAKNVAGACCSTRTNSRIDRVRRLEIFIFISSVGSLPSTSNVTVVHICKSSNKASNERRIPRLVTASTPSASFSSMMSLK